MEFIKVTVMSIWVMFELVGHYLKTKLESTGPGKLASVAFTTLATVHLYMVASKFALIAAPFILILIFL